MKGTKSDCIKFLVDAPEGTYTVKEWHERRSLDANAYYWKVLTELAAVVRTSKDELHEIMLSRYSCPYLTKEGEPIVVTIREDVPLSSLPGHWMYIRSGRGFSAYMRIKGSSDMDTKEFSRLLDALISECEEVGVSTLLPLDLEGLKGYVKAKQGLCDTDTRKEESLRT